MSVLKAYFGTARFFGAGPLRMRPEVSYCEPWQGQNQPPYSPRDIRRLLALRDAAEMGADADQDQPLLLAWLHALIVGLRIVEVGEVDVLRPP